MYTISLADNCAVQVQVHVKKVVDGETYQSTSGYVLFPEDDISGQPEDIVNVCHAWWTEERVIARQSALEEAAEELAADS